MNRHLNSSPNINVVDALTAQALLNNNEGTFRKYFGKDLKAMEFSIREHPSRTNVDYSPEKYELDYAMQITKSIRCPDGKRCTIYKSPYQICNLIHDSSEAWHATRGLDNHFNRTNTTIGTMMEP